jgi:hypothetical protein
MGNKSSRLGKDSRINPEENMGIYYIPNNNSSAARRDLSVNRRLNNDSSLVSRGSPAVNRRLNNDSSLVSRGGPARNHRNEPNRFVDGFAPDLNIINNNNNSQKLKFQKEIKARTKLEFIALVEYFNILNKYYKMWFEYYSLASAKIPEFKAMLREELLKKFKITEDIIEKIIISITTNDAYFIYFRKLKKYIDETIQKHPTWVKNMTVLRLFEPSSVLVPAPLVKPSSSGSAAGPAKKIPELLIINYANRNASRRKSEWLRSNPISNETVKYREKLEDFAIYLKSKGINLSNNEEIIKNVKFFLEKYYNKPTEAQLETAIKAVRLFIQRKQSYFRKSLANFKNFE